MVNIHIGVCLVRPTHVNLHWEWLASSSNGRAHFHRNTSTREYSCNSPDREELNMEIYHQIGAGKKIDNLNSQQTQHVYVNQAAQSGPPFIQSMTQRCRFFV